MPFACNHGNFSFSAFNAFALFHREKLKPMLTFRYAAMALMRSPDGYTEIQVVLFDAPDILECVTIAEERFKKYASDFGHEYLGVVNVYQYGSDMYEEYGEVYSLVFKSDPDFEAALMEKLSPSQDD